MPRLAWCGSTELNQLYPETRSEPETSGPVPDWRGFIGAGAISASRAVGDKRTRAVPLFSVYYRDMAYWHGAQGGVWVFQNTDRAMRFGFLARLRRGYQTDADTGLEGMEQRDTSLEAGVNGSWVTGRNDISVAATKDVTGRSDGSSATVTATHSLALSRRATGAVSVGVEWLDAQVVDYYYGVDPSEATVSRPAYDGRATVNYRVGASVRLGIAGSASLLAAAGYTRFGPAIVDSPVVTRRGSVSFLVGGGWRF